MVLLDPCAEPTTPVATRGCEAALAQPEGQRAVDGDCPGPFGGDAANRDVPTGADEGGAGQRELFSDPLGRKAFADAAEIELEPWFELDPPAGDGDAAAAGGRGRRIGAVGDLVEGRVVAGNDECLVHRRVERPPVRARAAGKLDHLQQVRRRIQRTCLVE